MNDVLSLQGRTFLCGDIHGKARSLKEALTEADITDAHIIILGDCGFGINPDLHSQLDMIASEKQLKIYCIRGNHDQPGAFTGIPYSERLVCLKDYTLLHIGKQTALAIGGAVSIDRCLRTGKEEWWADEIPLLNHPFLDGLNSGVDLLLTHTGAPPPLLPSLSSRYPEYFHADVNLQEDLMEEQYIFYQIQNKIKPAEWFYGHFHTSCSWSDNGTRIRVLDTGELCEVCN